VRDDVVQLPCDPRPLVLHLLALDELALALGLLGAHGQVTQSFAPPAHPVAEDDRRREQHHRRDERGPRRVADDDAGDDERGRDAGEDAADPGGAPAAVVRADGVAGDQHRHPSRSLAVHQLEPELRDRDRGQHDRRVAAPPDQRQGAGQREQDAADARLGGLLVCRMSEHVSEHPHRGDEQREYDVGLPWVGADPAPRASERRTHRCHAIDGHRSRRPT
jgi:hypothetical protein